MQLFGFNLHDTTLPSTGDEARQAYDTLDILGQSSLDLVNRLSAEIAEMEAQNEAKLTDVLQQLSAAEARQQALAERERRATEAASEAESWLLQVQQSMKEKLGRWNLQQTRVSFAA